MRNPDRGRVLRPGDVEGALEPRARHGVATPLAALARSGESGTPGPGERLNHGASVRRLESAFGEDDRSFRAGYGCCLNARWSHARGRSHRSQAGPVS